MFCISGDEFYFFVMFPSNYRYVPVDRCIALTARLVNCSIKSSGNDGKQNEKAKNKLNTNKNDENKRLRTRNSGEGTMWRNVYECAYAYACVHNNRKKSDKSDIPGTLKTHVLVPVCTWSLRGKTKTERYPKILQVEETKTKHPFRMVTHCSCCYWNVIAGKAGKGLRDRRKAGAYRFYEPTAILLQSNTEPTVPFSGCLRRFQESKAPRYLRGRDGNERHPRSLPASG